MGTEKKREKKQKKKNGTRQNLCYESNKNICENNSSHKPSRFTHFIKLRTLCLLAILYITGKALLRYLNVPFKAIVFIFRFF